MFGMIGGTDYKDMQREGDKNVYKLMLKSRMSCAICKVEDIVTMEH
jgi:hypothetical protein